MDRAGIVARLAGAVTMLAVAAAEASLPVVEPEERAVLAASIAQGPGSQVLLIGDVTATIGCEKRRQYELAGTPDGCSGLRPRSLTPEQVQARLRQSFGRPGEEPLRDLLAKSQAYARLGASLALVQRQFVWGESSGPQPKDMKPDYWIKVSRVGFDRARRNAVAFLIWANMRDRGVARYGEYVLLAKQADGWRVAKRETLWSGGGGPTPIGGAGMGLREPTKNLDFASRERVRECALARRDLEARRAANPRRFAELMAERKRMDEELALLEEERKRVDGGSQALVEAYNAKNDAFNRRVDDLNTRGREAEAEQGRVKADAARYNEGCARLLIRPEDGEAVERELEGK